MKKYIPLCIILSIAIILVKVIPAFARDQYQKDGYIMEHEKDIAKQEPGPHSGGGTTTAYSFFSKEKDLNLVFRKRVLYPGSSIGYHLQESNEIYYILQGTGEMQMNGKSFPVTAGDAILTKPGSSHGLKASEKDSLVILINYEQHPVK